MPNKIFNYGNMQRDFTFIDDVVDAFVEMLSENIKNEILLTTRDIFIVKI